MSDQGLIERWWDEHHDFPLRLLGFVARHPRTHRPALLCLDCAADGDPRFSGSEAEEEPCARCGKHLRSAARFGLENEATIAAGVRGVSPPV